MLFSLPATLRALPPALFLLSFAAAQTCYYPDGQSISNDVPCNSTATASSCCGAAAFCMDNGLCFSGGVVSRGSCTDQTWGSPACAGYCKTVSRNAAVSILPCQVSAGANSFVCGLNQADCQSNQKTFVMSGGSGFILRTSQIEALVGPALAAPPSTAGLFTPAQLAGVGAGVGVPLVIALLATIFLLTREKRRTAQRGSRLYGPPDNDFKSQLSPVPPQQQHQPGLAPSTTLDASSYRSRASIPMSPSTVHSASHPSSRPGSHDNSVTNSRALSTRVDSSPALAFHERYETIKAKAVLIEADVAAQRQRVELHGGHTGEVERFELPAHRESGGT